MRKLLLPLLLLVGCQNQATGPGDDELYPAYFLASVDNHLLPVELAAGTQLIAASVGFLKPQSGSTGDYVGTAAYSLITRRQGQPDSFIQVQLSYAVTAGVLRIDLCPNDANCLVAASLVGPVNSRELNLVLNNNGTDGQTYRFFASLPD